MQALTKKQFRDVLIRDGRALIVGDEYGWRITVQDVDGSGFVLASSREPNRGRFFKTADAAVREAMRLVQGCGRYCWAEIGLSGSVAAREVELEAHQEGRTAHDYR